MTWSIVARDPATGAFGVAGDDSCDRSSYRFHPDTGVFTASSYPRPVPGVPKERNLHGISFAVANFTGLDDPYEAPESPEVECRTHVDGVEACVNQILQKIEAALDLPPVSLQPRVAALA